MSVGTLVKSIAMQIIADPGDSHAVLDDLSLKGDQLRRPITMVLTADGAPARAGIDEVTQAFIAYTDAALRADEAAARFAAVQATAAKDSAEYRAALDANTKASLRAMDAQIKLGEAEMRAAAGAKASGDAALASGVKAGEAGTMWAGFGEKMKLGAGAMMGIGVAVAGVGYESVKMAISFQRSMELLVTQAGLGKAQLAGLKTGVLQLAGQVGFSPDSLAESLFHVASNMASMGATSSSMLRVVRVAAEGAQVGNANLVDVTNALTAAVASGIPGVQNYAQAMGMLNAIVGSGDMTMQNLAEAFGSGMVAVVKGYGLSLTDVGAALAVFGDNNIRGAHAGTQLRMSVQALAVPAKAGITVLAQLGIGANQLAMDMQHGGLLTALKDLQAHFHAAGISAKEQGNYITTIFGKKAGAGLGVLLDQMGRLESKYPALAKGADGFATAWDRTKHTVAVELKQIDGSFHAVLITIGDKVLPVVEKVFGFLSSHTGVVIALASGIGILVGALALFTAATKIAGVAMVALDIDMEANPIGLVVVAVAALVLGLYELYKHCSWVRSAIHETAHLMSIAWTEAVKLAGEAIRWFEAGPLAWLKAQVAVFQVFWAAHGAEIMKIWKVAWTLIATNLRVVWDVIKGTIGAALSVIIGVLKASWDVIYQVVKTVWNVISTVISTVIHVILDVIGGVLDLIQGKWSAAGKELAAANSAIWHGIWTVIKDVASGFWNLLWTAGRDLIGGLIGGIKSAVGGLWSAVSSIGSGVSHAFTSALHIFSPSRVFYGHGQMIVEGLRLGMMDDAPRAVAAARSMAGAVSGGAAAGGGGSGGRAAGAGRLEITLRAESSDPLMAALLRSLRFEVRRVGGGGPDSVQLALGRVT